MKLIVQSKNINLNQNLQDYAEKKFSNLKKYFDNIMEIDVIFGVEKSKAANESHYIDANIWTNGMTMHAKERAETSMACVDLAVDKLEKQIKRYKEKLKDKNRKAISKNTRLAYDNIISIEDNEDEPKIIRERKFSIKPMFIDEAAMQLGLLKHEFLVFTNAESDKINVLYKRADGNYGLIAPENNF